MSRIAGFIIVVLLAMVAGMGWLLWSEKAEAPSIPESKSPEQVAVESTVPKNTATPGPLHERIQLSAPTQNATVGKSFSITGKAPGNWFFEASAPYMVRTPEGEKIAQGLIQAQGEWMTTELVDFTGDVSIAGVYTGPAIVVLLRDNPSGMPENDDSLEIPITIE